MGSEYTRSFRYPQRKKSAGLRSGLYGGQLKSAFREMILYPNCSPSQDRLHCSNEGSPILLEVANTKKHGDVIGGLDCLSLPLIVLEEMGTEGPLIAETHPDCYLFSGLRTLVGRISVRSLSNLVICR